MSHHWSDNEQAEMLSRLFGGKPDTGPTGRYPHGKLNERDEGEILIAIAADVENQVVVVDFGKPVASLGFTGEQAEALARMFQEKAWELRGIKS